jgi:hypothetical protein
VLGKVGGVVRRRDVASQKPTALRELEFGTQLVSTLWLHNGNGIRRV